MAHHLSEVLSQGGKHSVTVYSDKGMGEVVNGHVSNAHLSADVIVIGGGGIVSKGFWAFKGDGLERLRKSKKPIAFVNVNVTPDYLSDEEFCEQLRELKARWWVRNNQSVDLLAKIGIPATLVPDVSFRKGVVPERNRVLGRQKLAVFLNSYVFNQITADKDVGKFIHALHNVRVLARYLDWMSHYGWQITFYAAHTAKDVDDRVPSALVFSTMEKKDTANWMAETKQWNELIDAICESDLVVSMRYHSTCVALAHHIPCVDITHHTKNKSLLNELGIGSISVDYNSLMHESLVRASQYAENSTEYQHKLQAFSAEAHTRWELFDREWDTFLSNI